MANRLTESELTAICNSDMEYFDKLYDFMQKVAKINESAESKGTSVLLLKSRMKSTMQSYLDLCGIESEDIRRQFDSKKRGPGKNKCITVSVPQKNYIASGPDDWLLCPKCNGKLIKKNDDSVYVNCPIWCKRCKDAINVSWHSITP